MDEIDVRQIADAIQDLSTNIKYLGIGNASSEIGAIEFLAMEIKNGSELIAEAIFDLAKAVDKNASE